MGRAKGTKNKIPSDISYPRKCETCDYISNNPSMFHYHKKTHYSVEGKVCAYGCEQPAKFVSTQETYCCSKTFHLCPGYLETHSDRISQQWERPESQQRKIDTRQSFIERLHTPEIRERQKNTMRAKTGILTEERRLIFRRYAYACRKLAQSWAKDNGYEIGQQTFHVDHIYSVLDGFKNGIEPAIISHQVNLRILEAKKNSSKGPKSEITLEELLERIKQ